MPTARERALRTERFMDALETYIDARISYREADPEWRNPPFNERAEVEEALTFLLEGERA